MAATSGIATSKVSPWYLESNATSHIWPFSAIAELIDNAYDPDVDAKELHIDQTYIGDTPCLLFKDNGKGMDHEHLLKMLSFGYCEKNKYEHGETHKPIGHYGNGFKSGSMRLAKDALVFTVCKESAGIGFLSRSYLEAIQAETVLIPVLQYSIPELERVDEEQFGSNLEAILTHSPFKTEEDLLNELRDISRLVADKRTTRSGIHTGTNIYLFNLKKLHNGRYELDFQADMKDIQNPDVFEIEGPTKSADSSLSTTTSDKPQHLVSLRKYCSILFLKPLMDIIIRGQRVRREIISMSLGGTDVLSYKPTWWKDGFDITFGFTQKKEYNKGNYGIMLYNRNRLIKAYQKVGYQKKPDGKGLGVVGVVEVDCLTPIHNKQAFVRDEQFISLIAALGTKLNAYWDAQPKDILENLPKPEFKRVCCEECGKWRKIPASAWPADEVVWTCNMNPDVLFNECDTEEVDEILTPTKRRYNKKNCNKQPECDTDEETETETPAKRQYNKKNSNKKLNAGKRKARERKEKETKRARGETIESSRRSHEATVGTELNKYSDEETGDPLELLLQENDRCDVEEEPETEKPTKRRHSKKLCDEEPNAGKRKAGEDKGRETERNRRETIESSRSSEDPEKEQTFSTEPDVHGEDVEEQMEEDQQTRAADQKDDEENTEEIHLCGSRNSESPDISPFNAAGGALRITDMQQSRPSDINGDNAALQSMNLQAITQEPLYDTDRPSGYSFDGTDMETIPARHDIAAREAAYQNEKLVNRAYSSMPPQQTNVANSPVLSMQPRKTVPLIPVKTQVKPAPQTETSSSNQKNSSRSAPDNTLEMEATPLPAHQDTDLKRRFETFRSNVHEMLCKLHPDEDHGSVDEIENTVKNILANCGTNLKN